MAVVDYHVEEQEARTRLAELEEQRRSLVLAVGRGQAERASLDRITEEIRRVQDQLRTAIDLQQVQQQVATEQAATRRHAAYRDAVDAHAARLEQGLQHAEQIDAALQVLARAVPALLQALSPSPMIPWFEKTRDGSIKDGVLATMSRRFERQVLQDALSQRLDAALKHRDGRAAIEPMAEGLKRVADRFITRAYEVPPRVGATTDVDDEED